MSIIYILMKYVCMVITAGWCCEREAFCLFTDKETERERQTEMEQYKADGNQLSV